MATKKSPTLVKEQTKVDNSNLHSELIESKQIPNSPFVAQRYDHDWICTVGRYRSANMFKSFDDVVEYILNPDWELHMLVIQAVIDANENKRKFEDGK